MGAYKSYFFVYRSSAHNELKKVSMSIDERKLPTDVCMGDPPNSGPQHSKKGMMVPKKSYYTTIVRTLRTEESQQGADKSHFDK